MGGISSDIATADVVIMANTLTKVATAIQIAHKTRRIIWQNIGVALGIKSLFLLLGTIGIATLWEAVFADVGVYLLAVLKCRTCLEVKIFLV